MLKDVEDIQNRIKGLQTQLQFIQDNCEHGNIAYKYKSNTGNYCPSDDSYWVDIKCLDCGCRKTYYDDDKEGYRLKNIGKVSKTKTE